MAYRQIHTHIWKDEWFLELESDEKLLFVYLFSNESTTLAGIYKISLRVIAFETGLPIERVNEILAKFHDAGKVLYDSGIIWVVNLQRYNASTNSPKVQARIRIELAEIPDCSLKIQYHSQDNTPLIPYRYSIVNNSNNNINSKIPEPEKETKKAAAAEEKRIDTATVFLKFESEISLLTPQLSDTVGGWIDDYSPAWVIDAITEAVNHNARKPAYIAKILSSWKANGRNSKKPVKAEIPTEAY